MKAGKARPGASVQQRVAEGRYARQAIFAPLGDRGQERLSAASVAIVGAGATGSALALLLARAGVGSLRLIDRDFVEWNNLQRQLLYDEADVRDALPKAVAAERHLRAINSEIQVQGVVEDLRPTNVDNLLEGTDLVLDGTDNFEARYLVNDACVRVGRPWIYSGVVASYGMTLLVRPGQTACLRCLFPNPPPPGSAASCDTAGVLGTAVAAIAAVAASEAMKLLVGAETALAPGLVHLDLWELGLEVTPAPRRTAAGGCPCCVRREFPFLRGASSRATVLCGRDAVQITPVQPSTITLADLAARLAPVARVRENGHLLKAWVDDYELTVFPGGRAIIQGTGDEAVARSIYARYLGG
jgi:adenylyltransferase/sulfurtransferase